MKHNFVVFCVNICDINCIFRIHDKHKLFKLAKCFINMIYTYNLIIISYVGGVIFQNHKEKEKNNPKEMNTKNGMFIGGNFRFLCAPTYMSFHTDKISAVYQQKY